MKRPKIKIEKEPIDWVLDLLAALATILLVVLPIYYYSDLPDSIPKHYNLAGEPDAFENKSVLFALPVIGVLLFLGLSWLATIPHTYNYPALITRENASDQYLWGSRFMRFINASTAGLFLYLSYSTIQLALGNQSKISPWMLPVYLTVFFGVMAVYLFIANKAGKQEGSVRVE